MIDFVNWRCRNKGCKKYSVFGLELKRPVFCSSHQEERMLVVVHNRCQKEGCHKIPKFGVEWKKPLFCLSHRNKRMFDVVHKKCQTEGCDKITSQWESVYRIRCSCESKRLMQWSQDTCWTSTHCLHSFQSGYIHRKGCYFTSCFSQNKLGYLVIKKFKQEEWKHCLSTLCDTIQYWINHDHVTDKTVEVVHLFFSINH